MSDGHRQQLLHRGVNRSFRTAFEPMDGVSPYRKSSAGPREALAEAAAHFVTVSPAVA
jgi:hypothetical protein